MAQILVILFLFFSCKEVLAQDEELEFITVTSLPDALFIENQTILVEGSVVWLYCLVYPISPNLIVTWNKDGEPLVQDEPHILLRSSISDDIIFLLVVDNFQTSDGGEYQCIAQEGNIVIEGQIANLTAKQRIDGTIRVVTGDLLTTFPFPYTNRIGYTIGTVVSHQYVVGHVGDSSTAYQTPSVLWLKDGMPIRITPTNTPGTNGRLTTSIFFTFAASDAGVYQVVFNDTIHSELFITDPIRLDTGETLSIKAVSPPITILRPPEKLVLEVTATGRYDKIQWSKNGIDFDNNDHGNFANFLETYFNKNTTLNSIGVYEIIAEGSVNTGINLLVIHPVDVITNVSSGADASVYEGGNVDISCTSTGVPVPSIITWTFNNQATSYLQSDIYTDYSVNYNTNNFSVGIFPGNVVSTLHIVNAQYPADAGNYVCMGSKTHTGVTTNSSATITVQFIGLRPLIVTSFPEILFSQSLVEGSVAWLYCEVNSTASTLTVTWYKDGNALVQDVPHIITRKTSASASIFLLIVNDLQVSDSGEYQCSALDEYSGDTGMGMELTLTVSAATIDTLHANVDPFSHMFFADRTSYSSGDTATISCDAGYLSQSSFITTPEVTWLKDGVPIIHTPTNTLDSIDRLTTTISFTFTESDAGVYQCFFTDTTRSELLADAPIQVDTGTPSIDRLSPNPIIFRPPDKLVMEVRAAGEYYLTQWNKNGIIIQTGLMTFFPHFMEIYYIEPTSLFDAGVYEVFAPTINELVAPDGVQFTVIKFVDATTTASSMKEVNQGGFVDIPCTSTGVPVPTITWTLNNQSVPFSQTDTFTNYSVTVNGLSIAVTEGNVVSTLHIVNAQYPANAGEYVCIGSNTNGVSTISSPATIIVYIPVLPVVNVTATGIALVPGDDVTLTCNINRGNPSANTYTWTHVDTSYILTAETSPILRFSSITFDQLGSYRCEVTNSAGVGRDTITIELGYGAQVSAQELVVGIERKSVNISCNSTGIPVPTITWTINNQPVPYPQTDFTTNYRITFLGGNNYQIDQGIVFSYLFIANLQYSVDNDAVYTCIGSNSNGEDSAGLIRLQVLVPPEIEVRTDRTTVGLLDDVTLTCVVTRAVPMPDNYTLIHVDTNTTVVVGSSPTYTFSPYKNKIGTYKCETMTIAGYGMGNITIRLKDVPTLDAISIPDVLFSRGSQNILEGSVVWLYCLTIPKSPAVTVTWNKDGEPIVEDVPHIRLRSTGSDADMYSTFLLVVEPVDITDGGVYQCSAQEGGNIIMGPALTITVDVVDVVDVGGINGAIEIREKFLESDNFNITNFESYQSGDEIILDYILGHVGDDIRSYRIPSVLWLKDGLPFRIAPTNTIRTTNGRLITKLIFNIFTFTESDGGVYQLVSTATDSNDRLTIFLAHPIRLNTGTLTIEAVSPSNIIVRGTEKLVIKVRASGQYNSIEWGRNGNNNSFLPNDENFAHFLEVYYNEPIGISDFGIYNVTLRSVEMSSIGIQFTVAQYDYPITIVDSAEVYIFEGENVEISCTSTGIPVPTITWTVNNQSTPLTQRDSSTDHSVTVTADQATVVTQGNVVSTVHILNAQYPADFGEYVCIGSNTNGVSAISSSAKITVDIPVIRLLDVDVTADHTRVGLGGDVTLTCSVPGGNPIIYTYTWTHVSTSTTLTAETSPTLLLSPISMDELGDYRCVIRSGTFIGMNTITIELGIIPEVITRVNPPDPVIVGSIVSLVCEATAGDPPISYSWTGPTGEELSSVGNISVTISAREDYGTYTCTATNPSGTYISQVEVSQQVLLEPEMELCLSIEVSDCAEWINVNPDEKINDLELEILNAINQQCQCNVERDRITASQFMCLSPESLGFFFTINGTSQVPTSELLGYFESWAASGAIVTVQSQLLDVNMGICEFQPVHVAVVSFKVIVILPLTVVMTTSLFCILAVIAELCIKYQTKKKMIPQFPQHPRPPRVLPPLDVVPPLPPLPSQNVPLQLPQPLPGLKMDPPLPEITPHISILAQHEDLPLPGYVQHQWKT